MQAPRYTTWRTTISKIVIHPGTSFKNTAFNHLKYGTYYNRQSMAGYFPSSDHRRLRYPNIYGKAIRQNSNKRGDNHGHHHCTWWKPNTGINNHCQFQRHTADPPLIGVIKSTTYSSLLLSTSQGRHGLSLNLDHINIPTQNTNWSTRSLGERKKKKKNPTDTPQKT